MTSENLKIFILSTFVAIGLTIWGLLASQNNMASLLLSAQIVLLAVLAVLSLILANRIRQDRSQLGVVKLFRERRDGRELEYTFVSEGRKEVVLVGIIHRTFWSDKARFEDALEKAVRNGAALKIYFLIPDSSNLAIRAEEEHEDVSDWSNQICQTAKLFKDFHRRHPDAVMELFTYNEYPVWHLVLRDSADGLIGWYAPEKHGYDSPLYQCSLLSESGLAVPALQWFNSMRRSAIPYVAPDCTEDIHDD